MLETRAYLAEPFTVRACLFVVGLYLLALRARIVVVVNVGLARLLLGLRVKWRDFGHGTPPSFR